MVRRISLELQNTDMKDQANIMNQIDVWQETAEKEGWQNAKLIADVVRNDPEHLSQHLDYCVNCDRAIADLSSLLGPLDENDARLLGAQNVPLSETTMCRKCAESEYSPY